MTTRMAHLRNELLTDTAVHTARVAQDLGVSPAVAEQLGSAIADHLAEHWGGQVVNIPKNHFYRLAKRELEIMAAFNGHNFADLAREYGMTMRGIRKLVSRAIVRQRDLYQAKLFD